MLFQKPKKKRSKKKCYSSELVKKEPVMCMLPPTQIFQVSLLCSPCGPGRVDQSVPNPGSGERSEVSVSAGPRDIFMYLLSPWTI